MTDGAAVRRLVERGRIADVINTLFVATETREWARVRSCFAPVVTFDMSSVGGGAAQELSPEQIVSGLGDRARADRRRTPPDRKPVDRVQRKRGDRHLSRHRLPLSKDQVGERHATLRRQLHLSPSSAGRRAENRPVQVQPEVRRREPAAREGAQRLIERLRTPGVSRTARGSVAARDAATRSRPPRPHPTRPRARDARSRSYGRSS